MPAPDPSSAASGGSGPKINPATGLSTDYLNHFTEAVMMLEMVGAMPECIDDLRAWKPKTYTEHFGASRFSNREAVIGSYRTTDPAIREALDRNSDALIGLRERARGLVLRHAGTAEVARTAKLALERIEPLLTRTTGLINGTAVEAALQQGPLAAIDAMFAG